MNKSDDIDELTNRELAHLNKQSHIKDDCGEIFSFDKDGNYRRIIPPYYLDKWYYPDPIFDQLLELFHKTQRPVGDKKYKDNNPRLRDPFRKMNKHTLAERIGFNMKRLKNLQPVFFDELHEECPNPFDNESGLLKFS